MRDCPSCGKPVRLGANRIRVNRKQGVYHYIAHMDGAPLCIPGEWSTVMLKPYPKNEALRPRVAMVARWDALERRAVAPEARTQQETASTSVAHSAPK